jgi:hypothetical protein
MPTDRGLAIIGFEIIDWSCVKNEKRETAASTADSWLPVHATDMLYASRTCSGAATCNVRKHWATPNITDHKRQTGNSNRNRNRKPHADCITSRAYILHSAAWKQRPIINKTKDPREYASI